MALVTEDHVELQSIGWFKELGYKYVCGYDIALDGEQPERLDYQSVYLKDRLRLCLPTDRFTLGSLKVSK